MTTRIADGGGVPCACGTMMAQGARRCGPCFWAARKLYPRKIKPVVVKKTVGGQPTHGLSQSKTYEVYRSMIKRCGDPNGPSYANYGGRGITVCERWRTFEKFYEDMGLCPVGLSLDRIDVNGHYCKDNCRWVTMLQQHNNTRTNHPLTYNGRTQTIADWARELGMSYYTLNSRINIGAWTVEDALTTPVRRR